MNQSLFGGKNAIAVVILERVFAKMCVVAKTSFPRVSSFIIFDQERIRLPPVKITVQNLLLTKGKLKLPRVYIYFFSISLKRLPSCS